MENDTVIIDVRFNAPVTKLWQVWTDPALILQWFGSDPLGKGISAELDVKAGKNYRITFSNSDGAQHTCFGTYQTVIKPQKLTFSWNWVSEPGVTSTVTVDFEEQGEHTLMHFEQAGIGTASAHDYIPGWQSTFEKLRKVVES